MDQDARCGITGELELDLFGSQRHECSATIDASTYFEAFGYHSQTTTLDIAATVLGTDDNSPWPGFLGYVAEFYAPCIIEGTALGDAAFNSIQTTLEFDQGPASVGGGGNLNYRGPWKTTTAYAVDDVTKDGTVTYVCIAPSTGNQPSTSPTYWDVLGAAGGGASDAAHVSYSGAYATVQEALDVLLYVAPRINSFSNNVGSVEKGASVASVTLTWSFNKTMTTVSLSGVGSLPVTQTSQVITGPFTANQSWTLAAGDGKNNTSASTSISFMQKRYWGTSTKTSLTNDDILAFSSEFASANNKPVVYDCTGGKYPYFCFPASWGPVSSVAVGGLAFSDYSTTTQAFTNASGYTDNYFVVRFNGLQTGASIQVVW